MFGGKTGNYSLGAHTSTSNVTSGATDLVGANNSASATTTVSATVPPPAVPPDGGGGRTAGLQEPREVTAFAQLRDLKVNRTGSGLPEPFTVAVSAVDPIGTAFSVGCGAKALGVHVHHALSDELDHVPEQIRIALCGKHRRGRWLESTIRLRCGNQRSHQSGISLQSIRAGKDRRHLQPAHDSDGNRH